MRGLKIGLEIAHGAIDDMKPSTLKTERTQIAWVLKCH